MTARRERKFKAETAKLLDLMIHSVYTQREAFLRELVSNASDAIDKARILALTDPSLAADSADYAITLIPDRDAGTLTIRDNGIGMTYDEVAENIGTIARSGSEAFAAALEGEGAAELIGRFGVGFYSAFMVAERVELTTTRHGADHGVAWSSEGGESYHIARTAPGSRGTTITLHLRPAARGQSEAGASEEEPPQDFTDPAVLRAVVKRHSDFVAFPIRLEVPGADGDALTDVLNTRQPIWTRAQDDVPEEGYHDFYRHIAHDWRPPLSVIRVQAEGTLEYTALLFLPSEPPLDLYTAEHRRGLQLYVRRVFIMEEARELLPEHLRFVRGVLDSPDLPLSISREAVQEDARIAAIRRHLTRRVHDELARLLSAERERYEGFWQGFGAVVKEGFAHAPEAAERLRDLVLVRSTHGDGWTTLAEYAERMPDDQDAAYYLIGERLETLRAAPQLEALRARGVEVLLLTDAVDEWVVNALGEIGGRRLVSAASAELRAKASEVLTPGGGAAEGPGAEALAGLVGRIGGALAERVGQVRLSERLVDSAACLVDAEGAPSARTVRLMAALGQPTAAPKRILELNPEHALVRRLHAIHALSPGDSRIDEAAELLYDLARIAEGEPPSDAAAFSRRATAVMAKALGGADTYPATEEATGVQGDG